MARTAAARRRRRWIAALAVTAVLGIATTSVVLIGQRASAADPALTTAVRRADVVRSVGGTGTLVDELTYAVAGDGSATLTQRAGTPVGGTAAGGQSSAGAATTVSVAVGTGDRVQRGGAIARVQGADGRDHDVDAPVTGHVRSITSAPHAGAAQLVTIGAGRVLAALTVSENQIAQVRSDQRVTLVLAAGTASTTGVVDTIEQVPDDSSGVLRYTVLVRPDHLPAGARIGMSVTGTITTARAEGVLAVPAAAIEVRGAGPQVRVQSASTTRAVQVRLGLVGDSAVEVLSGLREGQRVVVGAAGDIAATTQRLGPPASVTGGGASATPTTGTR